MCRCAIICLLFVSDITIRCIILTFFFHRELFKGDRFGGALDAAARQFSEAYDKGQHPMEFVNAMRKKGELIMGIGHRVKSINNPDMRVTIIKVINIRFCSSQYLQNSLYIAMGIVDSFEEVECGGDASWRLL